MICQFMASLVIALIGLSFFVATVTAAPSDQASVGEVYIVQAEDWLSKIAEKYYGDALAYPLIVEATNAKAGEDATFAVIPNPDVIEVGQQLWIPAREVVTAPAPVLGSSTPILPQIAEIGMPADTLAFSPDDKLLALDGWEEGGERVIQVWDTQAWSLRWANNNARYIAFSPNSHWLAGVVFNGETDNKILIWEVPTWRVVAQMNMADVVQNIVFSPDSQWLVAGLGQGIEHPPAYEAQLWEVATGKLVARMPHHNQVQAVAFSHNGKWIATGSVDRTVKVWELAGDE